MRRRVEQLEREKLLDRFTASEARAKEMEKRLEILAAEAKAKDAQAAIKDGLTPAHFAAANGHVDALRFVVEECGSEVLTAADEDGLTPAYAAALEGQRQQERDAVVRAEEVAHGLSGGAGDPSPQRAGVAPLARTAKA